MINDHISSAQNSLLISQDALKALHDVYLKSSNNHETANNAYEAITNIKKDMENEKAFIARKFEEKKAAQKEFSELNRRHNGIKSASTEMWR